MQQNIFFSLEQVIDRQPIIVSVNTPLNRVVSLMQEWGNSCNVVDRDADNTVNSNNSCVLIADGDRLQGIFTERDLVKVVAIGTDTQSVTVGEIMTTQVVTITPTGNEDVFTALSLLKEHRIRHLPVVDESQNLIGLITAENLHQKLQPIVSDRTLVQEQLYNRIVQQQAVAELGQFALCADNLDSILDRAVHLVASTLEVEYCKVLQLLPNNTLLLKAGVGWQAGLVGMATLGIEESSQAGYALGQSQPVIVDDLRTETRFSSLPLLIEHQIISGMSVMITNGHIPFGVLGTYTTQHRVFNQDDINFLRAIANIIAQANERKQAEICLKESQERYILAINGSHSGIYDWDITNDKVFYAPHWQEILGCTDADLPNTIEAWSTKLHPEDSERVLTALQNHLENRVPYNIEYRLRKKNGDYCWIQGRGQAIWNESGQPVRMAGSITDISDRKRREEVLKDIASGVSIKTGTKFLPSLVEYLSKALKVDFAYVGTLIQPEQEKIATTAVYAQGQIVDNFEYYLAGTPCTNVLKQELCIYPQAVQQLFPDSRLLPEMKAQSFAGMSILNREGKAIGLIAIVDRKPFVDISLIEEVLKIFVTRASTELERQHAETKNREQAALLDVATDAIMVRDLDNKIIFWSRGAENLYGWVKQEVLNLDANELLYHESLVELNAIEQIVREQGEWQGELKQVTKAGREVVVESRWTLVRDEAGNPKSYLVVNTDVTEQKQIEAQFLRTQRLESLGTLAGGIAHDLNNILAPVLGFSKLLPLKLPDVDEQTKGFFKIMENNANRGTALVKQILTFSCGLEGERGIVQICHLIAEIAQIVNETFPKSIELATSAPKNLWTVNANVNQLHQVLMNLAVNARDAMTDGGKLTINAENTTVDAEYARLHLDATEGSYVLITVTDTGSGIPPEVIDRIFEPFFTTKEVGRGTGLGLSTVIGIIKSHGGFVEVTSNSKKITRGTQFKVYLPASDMAVDSIEEIEEVLHGNGELILVVDDETAILEVTKATLEIYNYKVLTAIDGIKAIATYAQNQENIKAVIMDIMMPAMDGKTAIRTLKQINPELKIIAVSGLIERQEIVAALDGDVTAFMNKPYSNDDLLKMLREVVSN